MRLKKQKVNVEEKEYHPISAMDKYHDCGKHFFFSIYLVWGEQFCMEHLSAP